MKRGHFVLAVFFLGKSEPNHEDGANKPLVGR